MTKLCELHETKLSTLSEVIFNLLWTRIHRVEDKGGLHFKFVHNSIADSIWKFSARLYSGHISERAQNALEKKVISRSQLCKEHPQTRSITALNIINTFNNHSARGSSNTAVISDIKSLLTHGSKVNFVLSEENVELAKYQRLGLDPHECYHLAGIKLVPDKKEPRRRYHYLGKVYNSQPEIVRDLNISRTTVQRRIKTGQITVENIND